ncbi:hypothetical protein EV175_005245 [Coemansia sp. RSA 1933]|nr:hypothetical protein EV175_005245 [Coemansia sp. RSA 1933]
MNSRLLFRSKSLAQSIVRREAYVTAVRTSKRPNGGGKKPPLNREACNAEVMGRFMNSVRDHRISDAWKWYRVLAERSHGEGSEEEKGVIPGQAVARRVANGMSVRMMTVYGNMLQALSIKDQFGYNREDLRQMVAMACEVLDSMAQMGGTLSSAQLNWTMRLFAAAGDVKAAQAVWQHATLGGLARDVTNYNAFMACMVSANELDQAFALLREMAASGIQPNMMTQNMSIMLHGLAGDLQSARDVFSFVCSFPGPLANVHRRFTDASKHQYWHDSVEDLCLCGPRTATYNAMLDVLGMNGLVDEMHELLVRMCHIDTSNGVPSAADITRMLQNGTFELPHRPLAPDRKTFHVLIKWRAQYWDLDTAEQYVRLMAACGIKPVPKTFKLMITPKTAEQQVDRCLELVELMAEEYNLEQPMSIIRMLDRATRSRDEMKEMIRISEEEDKKHPTSFLGIPLGRRSKDN